MMAAALLGVGCVCLAYGGFGLLLWNSRLGNTAKARKWFGHGMSLRVNRFISRVFLAVGAGFFAASIAVAMD